jgi:hypothetical protein
VHRQVNRYGGIVDYQELFSSVRRHPGAYGVPDSMAGFVAFLQGVDYGNAGQFLAGFRELLVVRAGKGANLTWPGLVWHIAFPGNSSLSAELLGDPERERHAIDTLFQLLDEFLKRRSGHGEPAKIFGEYHEWRRTDGLSNNS